MYGSLGTQLLQWVERGVNVNTHNVSLLRQKYAVNTHKKLTETTEKLKTVKAKAKLNPNIKLWAQQKVVSLQDKLGK